MPCLDRHTTLPRASRGKRLAARGIAARSLTVARLRRRLPAGRTSPGDTTARSRAGPPGGRERLADVEREPGAHVVRAVVVEADAELGHQIQVVVELVLDAGDDVGAGEIGVVDVVDRLE